MPSLIASGVKGLKWNVAGRAGKQVLQFITLTILANLLDPTDFGLIGMAMIVIGFINIFRDLGISAALIQRPKITSELFSSVYWFNIFFAFLFTITIIILSDTISVFYEEPRLTEIMTVLAAGFLINSFSILQMAVLEKELRFELISKLDLLSTLFGSTVAIILAILDYGVWSLVFQSLITFSINSILLFIYCPMKPNLFYRFAEVKKVMNFSLYYSGFNLTNYMVRNVDYLLIGKFLGAQELGIYSLAYRIMLYPIQNITDVIARVIFPVFSRIQNDIIKLRKSFLYINKVISLIVFPLMIGLIVTSENFTKIFLGEKWLEIVPVLMILAPIGMIQAIYTPAGTLYQSLGKVKIWFYWGVFTAIFFTIAFIIGLKWGILGVALAYLFANIITIIPGLYIPFQFIDLKLSTFEKVLRKNLALSLFMGVVIFIFDFAFSDYNAVLTFSATVIFGVLIYIPINIKFNKSLLDSIISLLKNKADKSIIDKTVIN